MILHNNVHTHQGIQLIKLVDKPTYHIIRFQLNYK